MLETLNCEIPVEMWGPVGTIVAAIIAPVLGLYIYFKRKEYDDVREIYLENGINKIVEQIEMAQGIFRNNWARSLAVIQHYRNFGNDMSLELLEKDYIQVNNSIFDVSKAYLINDMLENRMLADLHELFFSFIYIKNIAITTELITAIKISLKKNPDEKERKDVADRLYDHLKKLNNKFEKYYGLTICFQDISKIMSKRRYTFKSIGRIRKQDDVINSLVMARNYFKDVLREEGRVIIDDEELNDDLQHGIQHVSKYLVNPVPVELFSKYKKRDVEIIKSLVAKGELKAYMYNGQMYVETGW